MPFGADEPNHEARRPRRRSSLALSKPGRIRQGVAVGAHGRDQPLRCTTCAGARTTSRHGALGRLPEPFALHAFPPGFLLQFPHQSRPTEIASVVPYPKLFSVFEEASHLLDRLGVRSAGALNDVIASGRLAEVSLVGEAIHESRIAHIASDIAAQGDRVKLVLIAGPSSSGKTTFSKRLSVQLLANGRRPFPIALDDYFVDRERTPRDASGQFDYECLEAVDVALFNEHLLSLMAGRTTELSRYLFKTGRREKGSTVTLSPDHIMVVEGIHGLNPALVPSVPPESHLPHLRLRPHPAQPGPLQQGQHHRLPPGPAHRPRHRDARLQRDADAPPLGHGDARREAVHLPVPGKQRRHLQLGAHSRTGGPAASCRAAAPAGAARHAGVHRGQPAPVVPPVVRPGAARAGAGQLDPARVHLWASVRTMWNGEVSICATMSPAAGRCSRQVTTRPVSSSRYG